MKSYFIVVVDMPAGPLVITNEDDTPRVFDSAQDARTALRSHQIVRAYGAEAFEIGRGETL